MKKYLLGLAAVMCVLGIILMGSGWAMGAQTQLTVDFFGRPITVGMTGFSGSRHSGSADANDSGSVSDLNLAAFQNLEVDISLGDVIFRMADDFGLEMEWYGRNYELHYTNENGTLKIWSSSTPNFGINMNVNYGGTVTIYLPQGARFDNVEIETDLGEAELWGFQAKNLTVDADLGDVSMTDIEVERAELILDLGNLTATNLTANESLTIEADLGNVEISGVFYGDTEIDASLGNVFVDTALSKQECRYDLDASLGDIHVDGKKQEDHVSGGSGGNSITVNADLGNIDLIFA